MSQYGDKPKLLAIGVAPLGIVSIGIVLMGVVSIGVVPMGVVSVGVVGMGIINACVVGMGVLMAGINVMGIWTFSPSNSRQHHSSRPVQENFMAYPSKVLALEKSQELGCKGVHAMGSLWIPCAEYAHPKHC